MMFVITYESCHYSIKNVNHDIINITLCRSSERQRIGGVWAVPRRRLFRTQTAHFSDRGHLFQADRGRRFRAIVDAQGMRASEGLNVSQAPKLLQDRHREAVCLIATVQTYPRRRTAHSDVPADAVGKSSRSL